MSVNARQLGFDGTVAVIRDLLFQRFRVKPEALDLDSPLFDAGVGLTSLEGMELLAEIEKQFNIQIKDLEEWIFESPTLATAAQRIIDLSNQQNA